MKCSSGTPRRGTSPSPKPVSTLRKSSPAKNQTATRSNGSMTKGTTPLKTTPAIRPKLMRRESPNIEPLRVLSRMRNRRARNKGSGKIESGKVAGVVVVRVLLRDNPTYDRRNHDWKRKSVMLPSPLFTIYETRDTRRAFKDGEGKQNHDFR